MRERTVLQTLLADERRLYQAYKTYLPLLQPVVLREKIQPWVGDGSKHIEALERIVGAAPDQVPPAPHAPRSDEKHDLLDFFYQQEERLYYRYQDALKQIEEEPIRSLLLTHLQDQKRHLAGIQRLYAEFLYY